MDSVSLARDLHLSKGSLYSVSTNRSSVFSITFRGPDKKADALMENRNGLVVGGGVTIASGTAEREAALDLIDKHHPVESKGGKRRITLGGDKGFDVAAFIEDLRGRKVTPHVAVQDRLTKTGKRRKTKIDGRTTRHPGYGVSQRCRKRIEEIFGWAKTQAGLSKTKFRGKRRVDASFTLALAAYNLIRLPRLLAEVPP